MFLIFQTFGMSHCKDASAVGARMWGRKEYDGGESKANSWTFSTPVLL